MERKIYKHIVIGILGLLIVGTMMAGVYYKAYQVGKDNTLEWVAKQSFNSLNDGTPMEIEYDGKVVVLRAFPKGTFIMTINESELG